MEDAGHAAPAQLEHRHQNHENIEEKPPLAMAPAVDRLGRELQKWIQCTKCMKWRKVPYTLDDALISEDWTCLNNVWDDAHASCDIDQQLSDDEIDSILQYQADQLEAAERAQAAAAAAQAAVLHEPTMHELAASYDDPSAYDDDDYEEGSRRNKRTNGRWGRGRGRGRGRGAPGKPGRGRRGSDYDAPYRALPGRPRAAGRFAGRDQDEAAEALLGMGFAYGEEGEEPSVPRKRYPPGKVVWAKVEGHDWWPGKVVRRRAVPREVGLPPGGPEAVRFQIPVVFFGANGIPGEVLLQGNAISDPTQAALHALKPAAPDDDAEYAWLPAEALKAFMPGDTSGSGEGEPEDEALRLSISAANRAVIAEAKAAADDPEGAAAAAEIESDSDGGWGPQTIPSSTNYRGGRRGGRGGRRGKGRGGRRGRGRGRWGRYEEDDGSDEDYEPGNGGVGAAGGDVGGTAGHQRIIVEAILGWKWPGQGQDTQAGEEQGKPPSTDIAAGEGAGTARMDEDEKAPGVPAPTTAADADANKSAEDDIAADAVAALLAAAEGDEGTPER
jgi:hypothetical protein